MRPEDLLLPHRVGLRHQRAGLRTGSRPSRVALATDHIRLLALGIRFEGRGFESRPLLGRCRSGKSCHQENQVASAHNCWTPFYLSRIVHAGRLMLNCDSSRPDHHRCSRSTIAEPIADGRHRASAPHETCTSRRENSAVRSSCRNPGSPAPPAASSSTEATGFPVTAAAEPHRRHHRAGSGSAAIPASFTDPARFGNLLRIAAKVELAFRPHPARRLERRLRRYSRDPQDSRFLQPRLLSPVDRRHAHRLRGR